jgi:hypothetical protein
MSLKMISTPSRPGSGKSPGRLFFFAVKYGRSLWDSTKRCVLNLWNSTKELVLALRRSGRQAVDPASTSPAAPAKCERPLGSRADVIGAAFARYVRLPTQPPLPAPRIVELLWPACITLLLNVRTWLFLLPVSAVAIGKLLPLTWLIWATAVPVVAVVVGLIEATLEAVWPVLAVLAGFAWLGHLLTGYPLLFALLATCGALLASVPFVWVLVGEYTLWKPSPGPDPRILDDLRELQAELSPELLAELSDVAAIPMRSRRARAWAACYGRTDWARRSSELINLGYDRRSLWTRRPKLRAYVAQLQAVVSDIVDFAAAVQCVQALPTSLAVGSVDRLHSLAGKVRAESAVTAYLENVHGAACHGIRNTEGRRKECTERRAERRRRQQRQADQQHQIRVMQENQKREEMARTAAARAIRAAAEAAEAAAEAKARREAAAVAQQAEALRVAVEALLKVRAEFERTLAEVDDYIAARLSGYQRLQCALQSLLTPAYEAATLDAARWFHTMKDHQFAAEGLRRRARDTGCYDDVRALWPVREALVESLNAHARDVTQLVGSNAVDDDSYLIDRCDDDWPSAIIAFLHHVNEAAMRHPFLRKLWRSVDRNGNVCFYYYGPDQHPRYKWQAIYLREGVLRLQRRWVHFGQQRLPHPLRARQRSLVLPDDGNRRLAHARDTTALPFLPAHGDPKANG